MRSPRTRARRGSRPPRSRSSSSRPAGSRTTPKLPGRTRSTARGLPVRRPDRLLRTVRLGVRGDGPFDRPADPDRGRVLVRHPRRREVGRAQQGRARVARGLLRVASVGSRSSRHPGAARTAKAAPATRPSDPMCRPKRRARRHRRPRRRPARPRRARSRRADRNSATSKRAAARRTTRAKRRARSDSSSSVSPSSVWCCSCSPWLCSRVLALVAYRRSWRRRHAPDARDRVLGAWAQALDHLSQADVELKPSATPVEFALRHAPAHGAGAAGPALMELAKLQTAALFAPDAPTDRDADGRVAAGGRDRSRHRAPGLSVRTLAPPPRPPPLAPAARHRPDSPDPRSRPTKALRSASNAWTSASISAAS